MSKLQGIVSEIKTLNIMEIAELVNLLQDEFGVSASSMAVSSNSNDNSSAAKEAEKNSFKIELIDSGADKMKVIKALRLVKKELGLMEAKSAAETLPYLIVSDANKADSENIKKIMEEAGAKVKLS